VLISFSNRNVNSTIVCQHHLFNRCVVPLGGNDN